MIQDKPLTVWIFQTGEPIHLDQVNARAMRAMNLSDELVSKGHQVVLWTSDFDHFSKKSRFGKATEINYSDLLSIKLIQSNGYTAHRSLIRFWDHFQLAFNLRKMLHGQIPPDVAFVGLPPVEAAWVMSRWLKKNEIPFMIDIKDTWPENYVDLFPKKMRFIGKFVFAPLFFMRNWAVRNADGIVSITEDFLNWARRVSNTNMKEFDFVAPLVPSQRKYSRSEELAAEDWLDKNNVLNDGRIRAYFVGSLNDVFDFEPIFFAAKNSGTEFVICGEGPLRETLENKFKALSNVIFLGWVNQTQSDALARRSTLALAPVRDRPDFNMSIPNKFFDAIRLAKPIVATDHGVAADFIKSYGIGVCYKNSDFQSLAKTIENLLINPKNLSDMSKNAESLFQTTYNPSKVYGDLVLRLADLSSANV
jgi:glycosyltransferase involved in cell wall biosynthesis